MAVIPQPSLQPRVYASYITKPMWKWALKIESEHYCPQNLDSHTAPDPHPI